MSCVVRNAFVPTFRLEAAAPACAPPTRAVETLLCGGRGRNGGGVAGDEVGDGSIFTGTVTRRAPTVRGCSAPLHQPLPQLQVVAGGGSGAERRRVQCRSSSSR